MPHSSASNMEPTTEKVNSKTVFIMSNTWKMRGNIFSTNLMIQSGKLYGLHVLLKLTITKIKSQDLKNEKTFNGGVCGLSITP